MVDDDNAVVDTVTRDEAHRKRLPHRTVMFFVFSPDGKILVTRRSMDKEFFKGYFSVILGGHVSAGESYEDALLKEMKEELGSAGDHQHLGHFIKDIPQEVEHVSLFKVTISPSKVDLDPGEFMDGEFLSPRDIEEILTREKFVPETEAVLDILRQKTGIRITYPEDQPR